MRLTWPFTGRSDEMRQIAAALAEPAVAGIVVCGAAGVGKSRMAREALDAAAATGCEVRWVVGASCARELPLGALASWAGPPGSDDLHLVCGVIESLTRAAPSTPVVVGVDDVQLLDDLSTFVLHQIVARRAAKLVLTIRDGESVPAGVQELWRAGQFDRLDLEPLSEKQTAALVSETLAGSLDPTSAARLWQLTRGNALYLRHIVEQEVAEGRLAAAASAWRWTGSPDVPRGLVDLIESRIGAVPAGVATVIDALAIGEPLRLSALRRIAEPDAVEDADIRGLINLDQSGTGIDVRLAHPLYGEVRRKRAAPTRLRRLRGLVATELAHTEGRDDVQVLVRRAALALDSDLPPDPDLLARAAQGAVGLADLVLADRLAGAAIQAGAGCEAMFTRAHALSWLGRGGEADEVLGMVPATELSEVDLARLTYLRASNMLWALGDPGRAKEIIDGAARIASGAKALCCIDAVRAVYEFAVDRPVAAEETAAHLDLDSLPPIVGAETAWALAAIRAEAGSATAAAGIADRGYAVAIRCSDAPHMRFNIADAHVGALLLAGRIDDAVAVADRVRAQAMDLPGEAQILGAAIAGRTALGTGRLDVARGLLTQGVEALSSAGHHIGWGYRYSIALVTALGMLGLIDEAVPALDALERLPRPFRSLNAEKSIARAWVCAGRGAIGEALETVLSGARRASENGQFAAEVLCLQTAVQFGDRTCAPRLGELAAMVEGPRVAAAARFAGALHDHDPVELASASVDFESMGDHVAALDAAALAAVAYRQRDLRGSALGCVARAEALAGQCGGADTPALRLAREPLPLTEREREIVLLLGEGLSNREIADSLTLSVRTVEGHIYHAMVKTGTTSRAELAALLQCRKQPASRTRPADPRRRR